MKNCREEWYDKDKKVAVTIVDVTEAAQALARGHLCGPTSAYYLTKALAAVSLLGAETSEKDETVILQMKCSGPLGGFNVECTSEGTLRGYTEKKILDAFDGLGTPKDKMVLGDKQIQITRSVPGRILSQGIAATLDGYLVGSLQRKACIYLEAAVNDEVEILEARGVLVEALPDSKAMVSAFIPEKMSVASRNILTQMGLPRAELRKTTPLTFACRCSPDRAIAMLGALSDEEKKELPPTLDITCHMCGKIFTVKTR
ncbi:MAG: Hsp33 family molecular chaperone HslO [Kiritimatiellia bacterium]|nr:Hsp33 family molecular chaperone HslO [Kiritimatiellia bacterium]